MSLSSDFTRNARRGKAHTDRAVTKSSSDFSPFRSGNTAELHYYDALCRIIGHSTPVACVPGRFRERNPARWSLLPGETGQLTSGVSAAMLRGLQVQLSCLFKIPGHSLTVTVPDAKPVLCFRISVLRSLTALRCRPGLLRGVLPGRAY